MAQRLQWQYSGEQARYDNVWLASLVRTFDTMSREPKTCDRVAIAELKAQLARPVAATAVSLIALH